MSPTSFYLLCLGSSLKANKTKKHCSAFTAIANVQGHSGNDYFLYSFQQKYVKQHLLLCFSPVTAAIFLAECNVTGGQ